MAGCFVDEDGSFYTDKAVANLEAEEKRLLSERKNRTYGCRFFSRTAPKDLGNTEVAERFFVSRSIIHRLRPTENPYDVLQQELESRQVFLTSKAIQMRVRRLDKKIGAGQHMSSHEILQHQYKCYKYFLGMKLWLGRFKGFPPVGYLKKCLKLTGPEMSLLRSLITRTGPKS